MPLLDGAINEILPFAPEGLVEAGDLLSLAEYAAHSLRKRGHIPGIALRELQNREARQATHMAAGLAQFIANRYGPGVVDDADLDKVEEGLLQAITALIQNTTPSRDELLNIIQNAIPPVPDKYELCEFYYFRHPTLKPGFRPAQGGLLANAATLYPQAWAYLQTTAGKLLCKTEAEWQALTKATWATLANGTQVGWGGIGGAPFYAPNTATGALRLPDLRGMYAEAAGFDSLGVGGVHGDTIRQIWGQIPIGATSGAYYPLACDSTFSPTPWGAFNHGGYWGTTTVGNNTQNYGYGGISFYASQATPTGNAIKPRAWGALACVYLGAPK